MGRSVESRPESPPPLQVIKKRMYMRLYRVQNKKDTENLHEQVATLEEELEKLQAMKKASRPQTVSSALSWKDISQGLLESTDQANATNASLKQKLRQYRHLVQEMKRWVVANSAPAMELPAYRPSWRNVSLLSNPESRELGKNWIMQQMYHQIEGTFHQFGFPAWSPTTDNSFNVYHMDFQSSGCVVLSHCVQTETDFTFDQIRAMYQQYLCSILMVDCLYPMPDSTIVEETLTTTLHRFSTPLERINLLCGEFFQDDRLVIVAQHIQEDDAIEPAFRQRHRSFWLEMTRLPNGRYLERTIHSMSTCFTPTEGYLSLDAEARLWGMDLSSFPTDDLKEFMFRQGILYQLMPSLKCNVPGRIESALTSIQHQEQLPPVSPLLL
ncbi:hypothetical protein Ae201684P_012929 [Aphanomyces euteiches]|uniref:Uncharacterized protein n=1 Tax=Aphanomyces euteiches TaxID=100861 RepID=A0A6G0XGD9_9STRA|nr:hypothetical protein Ae201684_005108 [Aphanomyces euteiches]KAH9080791.1 hypothetical protein Ae201684P_012929 [Aphanomyces euteiches]KAH9152793.1 hypothetical protein AeRB84_004839 [Aphanomyces euteiches]